MRVYGVDFTSRPGANKPITVAKAWLEQDKLSVITTETMQTFREFEDFLIQPGPWIAAIDLPFGQPRRLIRNLNWPERWDDYVRLVSGMGRSTFEATLVQYKATLEYGDKEHLRVTDETAGGLSPMKLNGVPLAKMFFRGAPRLLKSRARLVPVRPNRSNRIIVESYPALVARRWVNRRSYKNDKPKKQTSEMRVARGDIVKGLRSKGMRLAYGFSVNIHTTAQQRAINDASGDHLDAVLAAVQGAWAFTKRDQGFGMPKSVDRLEGWIADPGQLD